MSTKTPEEIAQATLDSHAIKPHWRRSGEQIAGLIIEAIRADRAQNPGPSFEELDDMLEEWRDYSGDVSAFIQRFVERWER